MALARVAAAQDFLQVRDLHAGVALSGGDGGVAQDLLNLAYVGPALQEVRGAGMAKPVRAHALGNARALSIVTNDEADVGVVEPSAPIGDEEAPLIRAREDRPGMREVSLQVVLHHFPQGNDAFLLALAADLQLRVPEIKVITASSERFVPIIPVFG